MNVDLRSLNSSPSISYQVSVKQLGHNVHNMLYLISANTTFETETLCLQKLHNSETAEQCLLPIPMP